MEPGRICIRAENSAKARLELRAISARSPLDLGAARSRLAWSSCDGRLCCTHMSKLFGEMRSTYVSGIDSSATCQIRKV